MLTMASSNNEPRPDAFAAMGCKVLTYLFHNCFVPSLGPAVASVPLYQINYLCFTDWLSANWETLPWQQAITETMSHNGVETFLRQLNATQGLALFCQSVWYSITLDTREAPRDNAMIAEVVAATIIRFEDGSFTILQNCAKPGPEHKKTTDAGLLTLLTLFYNSTCEVICKQGVNGIRDVSTPIGPPTPVDPFDVFNGLVLKHLGTLQPEYRGPVEAYLRVFSQLWRPNQKHMRAPSQPDPLPANAPKLTGGWGG